MKRAAKIPSAGLDPEVPALRALYRKSRKKKIFEWLAAFIGGGWLILEFVHWILIDHYHFPEEILDLTLAGLLIALVVTMAWRWFRSGKDPTPEGPRPGVGGTALTEGDLAAGGASVPAWKDSIAVLPFADLSARKDQDYFCDGMAEEIINALTRIRDLRVVARTSAFSFKGQDVDIREIGRKLGVESILEGSVRKAGDRLRISAQLIKITDGCHLWSETFDREAKDIFAIQDEIATEIVKKLRVDPGDDAARGLGRPRTESVQAYHLYLRGHQLSFNAKSLRLAIESFERALEVEPGYAQALAGLARAYFLLGFTDCPPSEVFPKVMEMAGLAIDANPRLAQAHAFLGAAKLHFNRDWEGARVSILKGLELNPQDADTHAMYSWLLMATGEMPAAIREASLAVELDPLSATAWAQLAACKLRAGLLDEAESDLRRVLEIQPDRPFSLWLLGHAHVLQGRFGEGLAEIRRALALSMGNSLIMAGLGWALAVAGHKEEAEAAVKELMAKAKTHYVRPYLIAKIYSGLGENDRAFRWLDKGFKRHDPSIPFILTDETMKSLRPDRRFAALLRKLDLA